MAVSQNICYKVVTIGWLKNFIGTKLQNSNGGTVYVGGSYDDSYCPTYLQLTNGSLLPYRSTSSSGPADDTDGITVNSICHATSQSYSSNQLVNIHDMAVCNTRLDSFTVSVDTSTIDGCNGGTRNLSYTRRFTRTTWDMLNCASQETPSSSSSSVNDTRNSLISWDTNIGNITNSSSAGSGKAVTVGKNAPSSDSGSSSRTITVTGSSTFRGSTATDTASVGQSGVGGSYKYWYTTQVGQTNYRVTCSGGPSFGCEGGSYSAAAKHDYKDRTYYRWQDVCGVNYDSWNYYSDSSTYTATDYTYSGSFPDISSAGGSNSDSWSKSGYAGSCSWSQSCSSPSTVYTYGTGTTSTEGYCAGGSVSLYSDNIPYTATTTYGDGSTASTTGYTAGTASVNIEKCTDTGGCTRTGTVSASKGSISYTISQTGCSPTCTEETITRYGPFYDEVTVSNCDPQTYNGSATQQYYSSVTIHTDCSETLNGTGLTSCTAVEYTLDGIEKNTSPSQVTRQLSTRAGGRDVWVKMTIPPCPSCTIAFTMSSGCTSGSEHVNFKAYDVCEDYANDVVDWTITFSGNTYNGTSFGIPSSTGQSGVDESWETSDRNKVTGSATVNWSLRNHPSVTGQSTVVFGTCETPSEVITLEYQINIPNYQDNGNLYLCTHTLQGNSHARELFRSGVALHFLVGQRFDVDTFEATKTNGRCKFKQVQTMGIVNDTSNGGVTVTNFSEDTPYYVVVVLNAEGQYSIFGTQANLKTQQFDSAGDCSDYVQDIN